ncbi:MAG: hypothetical protein LBL82_08930 [Oscillospiraceae bacterium]|jgi:hypothetical protein|nr:hypothetical protein [Oscillospiraceae bacterium]
MTSKELLYIEDVLAHEKVMQTACSEFSNQVQNTELKSFLTMLSSKHQQYFGTFYSLLG